MMARSIASILLENSYPGRGIILGRSRDGKSAVAAYFIMGRSANSRNRIFTVTEDGIRTQAHRPERMEDPSLIIYHPVRRVGDLTVVTNGDQTDTIAAHLRAGGSFESALRTREFEPDGPNFTPRISGLMDKTGCYKLSILKSLEGDSRCCCRFFYEYSAAMAGVGHFIHTYDGDGNPLPSFSSEPSTVEIPADSPEELARLLWTSLDGDNKVSLYVLFTDLESGKRDEVILNVNE